VKDAGGTVSHYRLETLLGSGSMGAVYRGVDKRDGSLVAVKLLHRNLAEDPSFRERFEQEAHVAALLRSPYTVQIVEYGSVNDQCFIAMEYVHGGTLKDLLRDGPLPPARAVRIAVQVARALEEAEARGIVHRDIKPENLLVRSGDAVKVADFGLARHASAAALTHSGVITGTLAYAAPEQLTGEADHRSDIYALGATLYCLLTGAPPFTGSLGEVAHQIRSEAPPPDRLKDVPAELADVIFRCLEKDPDVRFQSASALAAALMRASETAIGVSTEDATLPLALAKATDSIAMELSTKKSRRPFAATAYRLTVRNHSARAVTVHLRAEDGEDRCDVRLPEVVGVGPRSTAAVAVSVRPRRRRWRGHRETRIFSVYGSTGSGEPAVAVSGQFSDQPYGWRPVIGGASVLGVAAAAGLAVWFGGVIGGRPNEADAVIETVEATNGAFNAGAVDEFASRMTDNFFLDLNGITLETYLEEAKVGRSSLGNDPPTELSDYSNVRVDGAVASLEVWKRQGHEREHWHLSLIKDNGAWLLDGFLLGQVPTPRDATEVLVDVTASQCTLSKTTRLGGTLSFQVMNHMATSLYAFLVLRLPNGVSVGDVLLASDPLDVGATTTGAGYAVGGGSTGTWILDNMTPGRYANVCILGPDPSAAGAISAGEFTVGDMEAAPSP
jgi:predicted Ser/Thr protein kinase